MAELKEKMLRQRVDLERGPHSLHSPRCPLKTSKSAPAPSLPPTRLWGWRPSDLERWARLVFPLTFLTFHLLYWTILVKISDRPVGHLMPLKH